MPPATFTPSLPSTQINTIMEARLKAKNKMKYLLTSIMSMTPIECDPKDVPTMAVDEWGRLYYSQEFLNKMTLDEAAGVVLHECMHMQLEHADRRRRFLGESCEAWECQVWNIAADISINDILEDAGVKLPTGDLQGVNSKKFGFPKGLLTEEYYSLLMQKIDKHKTPQTCSGSGSDGVDREWEQGPPGDGKPGNGTQGLNKAQQSRIRETTAKAILEEAEGRGNVPGDLCRHAKTIIKPQTDPMREILSKVRYATTHAPGLGDYTYRKQNRRNPDKRIISPANVMPVPRIVFICDTSGSMGDQDLGLSLGVIAQALKRMPTNGLTVMAGDTRAAACGKYFKPEQVQLAGGGGTDMGALIVEAAALRPKPTTIVVLTDGDTGWPGSQPDGIRVVACITRKTSCPVPDWIDVIYLHPAEEN